MIEGILITILILFVLVLLHELGHFLMGKLFKVRILEFGIGFPPNIAKIWTNNRVYRLSPQAMVTKARVGNTVDLLIDRYTKEIIKIEKSSLLENTFEEFDSKQFCVDRGKLMNLGQNEVKIRLMKWSINLLPLGGFVRFFERGEVESNRSFESTSLTKKLVIILAGVSINLLIPFLLMPLAVLIPRDVPQTEPTIVEVRADSPAEMAGLIAPVKIIEINGSPINSTAETIELVRSSIEKGDAVRLLVETDGQRTEYQIRTDNELGIILNDEVIGYSIEQSSGATFLTDGWSEFINILVLNVEFFRDAFSSDNPGGQIVNNLVGPVGVAGAIGGIFSTEEISLSTKIFVSLVLASIISFSLGILNLLPIPALDGGRALQVVVTNYFKGPKTRNVLSTINAVTLVLLIALAIWVNVRDVLNLF